MVLLPTTTRAVTPVHVVTTTAVSLLFLVLPALSAITPSCSCSCGVRADLVDSDFIVAVNSAQQDGSCGKKVKITNTNTGKTATALAADTCKLPNPTIFMKSS
jgi:hypothetical protein